MFEVAARNDRRLLRIVCCLCVVILLFTIILQPMEAHALAIEMGLFWLFLGLGSLVGLSYLTYESVENQTPLTDLTFGTGESADDVRERFYEKYGDWREGLTDEQLTAAEGLANQIVTSQDGSLSIDDNRADLQTVADSVRSYWHSTFGDVTILEGSVSVPLYESTVPDIPGDFIIQPNNSISVYVNGALVPLPTGTVQACPATGVVDDSVSVASTTYWDFSPWLRSYFNAGYQYANLYLYESLGFNYYLQFYNSGSNYSISLYSGDVLIDTYSFSRSSGTIMEASASISFANPSSGTPYVLIRPTITLNSSDYSTSFQLSSDDLLFQFFSWVNSQYQIGNPSRYINGTGALALDMPDVAADLFSDPQPPEGDDNEEQKPGIIIFPPFPEWENEETGELEVVSDPEDLTWSDIDDFSQSSLLGDSADDGGTSGTDEPEPTFRPPTTNLRPPSSFGIDSIFYYVEYVYEYVAAFFSFVGILFTILPVPVVYIGWATVVLIIAVGVFRNLI